MKKYYLTWDEVYDSIIKIRSSNYQKKIYGVPRGGSIIAGLTLQAVDAVRNCDIIVDDIVDSGQTYKNFKAMYPHKPFITAFNKNEARFKGYDWIIFPWEHDEVDTERNDQINRLAITFGEKREEAVKRLEELSEQLKDEIKSNKL